MVPPALRSPTTHSTVNAFVAEVAALCEPAQIHWCDGSEEENTALCKQLVDGGTFIPLNPDKRPGSYLARSHPGDVARVEHRTFICSKTNDQTGPTNNWADPAEMKETLRGLFKGCMHGRAPPGEDDNYVYSIAL